jgi:6-phosphofructokinase 1
MDRVLATRYGTAAADMIARRDYGNMVALKNNDIIPVPLSEVTNKLNLVEPDHPLVLQAKNMGTSFGE